MSNQCRALQMKQSLGLVSLVVRDYDEALDFFVGKLGFLIVEDLLVPEQAKRWVVITPPVSTSLVFCLQGRQLPSRSHGSVRQTGGRVFLFLNTDNFWRDY